MSFVNFYPVEFKSYAPDREQESRSIDIANRRGAMVAHAARWFEHFHLDPCRSNSSRSCMKRNNLETKRLARTTFRTLMLIVFFLLFILFFFVVSQYEETYRYNRIARVPYHSRTSRLTEKQFVERLRRLLKSIEILLPDFRRRDLVHGRAGEFSKKQRHACISESR